MAGVKLAILQILELEWDSDAGESTYNKSNDYLVELLKCDWIII